MGLKILLLFLFQDFLKKTIAVLGLKLTTLEVFNITGTDSAKTIADL